MSGSVKKHKQQTCACVPHQSKRIANAINCSHRNEIPGYMPEKFNALTPTDALVNLQHSIIYTTRPSHAVGKHGKTAQTAHSPNHMAIRPSGAAGVTSGNFLGPQNRGTPLPKPFLWARM